MTVLERVKKSWWVFAGLIVLIIVIVFFTSCGSGSIGEQITRDEWTQEMIDAFNGYGIPNEYTNFKHDYTTPKGIKIKSVVPVPAEALGWADEGAQRQSDRFAQLFPEWANARNVNETIILIIHPNQTFNTDGTPSVPCVTEVNDPGAPCIYVRGIKTAGTVLGLHDRWDALDIRPAIVLAHQQAQNWTYREWFITTVHNEREHLQGFKNRHLQPQAVITYDNGGTVTIPVFNYYLGPRDTHPWQWPLVAGLVAQTPSNCGIE